MNMDELVMDYVCKAALKRMETVPHLDFGNYVSDHFTSIKKKCSYVVRIDLDPGTVVRVD